MQTKTARALLSIAEAHDIGMLAEELAATNFSCMGEWAYLAHDACYSLSVHGMCCEQECRNQGLCLHIIADFARQHANGMGLNSACVKAAACQRAGACAWWARALDDAHSSCLT